MYYPNTWLIADTHFGHKNIIDFENRPFKTVEEMDEAMILNWNILVKKEDTVYVLGDFSFHGADATRAIIKILYGNKILIMGNHDYRSVKWWYKAGFLEVYKYPIIVDDFFILSHEPMYVNKNMPYANIFGHVHNRPEYNTDSAQTYCVSVERINYMPIEFDKVKKIMLANAGNAPEITSCLPVSG